MAYALVLSLLANLVLAVALFRRTGWWYCHVRFWFLRKPDFARVRAQVEQILAEPEFREWFELMELTTDTWMADLRVRSLQQVIGENWSMVRCLADRVAYVSGLPCWPRGWVPSPDDPTHMVGTILGIGHDSPCRRRPGPPAGIRHPDVAD